MKKKFLFSLLIVVFLTACIFSVAAEDVIYDHVVIIGVDGAGAYFRNTDTPCIDSIFADGAVSYEVLTSDPTISAQCWASLLHGVTPNYHGITNTIAANTPFPINSPYPSIFRVVREKDEDAVLASFVNWSPINYGIVEEYIDVHKVSGLADAALTEKICEYVVENSPKLLFVQFDEADHVGHSSGFGGTEQLEKITELDGYIGNIYNAYVEAGIVENTLFCVTADHGGNGKSHGGWTEGERNVMFAAKGKSVVNGEPENMQIRDVAAVVLHAFGYTPPKTWTACVPGGLFEGVSAERRPYYTPATSSRYFDNALTPSADSEYYVTKYLTDKTPVFYLPFDGNVTDNMGNATTVGGDLSYADGYFGDGVVLDNGYVSLGDYEFGSNSFSFAFWLRTEGLINSDPPLVSNKDWDSGAHPGICFAHANANRFKFNASNGSSRTDFASNLDEDFYEGWMYVVLSVDRENEKIGISYDFSSFSESSINSSLSGASFDSGLPLNIGQDGLGAYNQLPCVMDEFMLFDEALTEDDLQALKEYYTLPLGDVDGDREVGIKDTLLALKAVTNSEYLIRADYDGNGELSLLDVIKMLKTIV